MPKFPSPFCVFRQDDGDEISAMTLLVIRDIGVRHNIAQNACTAVTISTYTIRSNDTMLLLMLLQQTFLSFLICIRLGFPQELLNKSLIICILRVKGVILSFIGLHHATNTAVVGVVDKIFERNCICVQSNDTPMIGDGETSTTSGFRVISKFFQLCFSQQRS